MPARISRTSPFSGLIIQDAFPELTDGAREFIKSGITPLEWAKYMGEEDE
jgi:hypothetical protein